MKTTYSNLFALLQIFAFDPQAQPANNTGSNSLAAEIKTFYDKMLIKEAKPNLIHDQFAVKKPIPKGRGKTIEFRKMSPLPKANTPLVEGVSPDGRNLEVTTFTATVSQYGDFIHYTDMLQMTSLDNLVVEGLELLSAQAGVTLDTITRNAINCGTNGFCASSYDASGVETKCYERQALTSANKLTVKEVKKAVTRLKKANTPKIDGSFISIIHPCVSEDIQNDPEFIEAHKYAAPDALFEGEIGKIAGVRFMESTEAKIFAGENLAGNTRNLTVNGAVSSSTTVNFTGGTVSAGALKGRTLLIDGDLYTVANNTASAITLTEKATLSDKAVIYPGEGGAEGCSVFSCLFFGKGAYATTDIEGGGAETFVKQLGSGGTSDPLNQRSTVGWKANKVSEILVENYLCRVEVGSSYNDEEAN